MKQLDFGLRLETISIDRGYWFVRTDGGKYFETYYENNFIAIGWNQITLDEILNKSATEVHQKIAKTENINLEITKGKSKVTSIYNKLLKFTEIKKGDIIIIPSYNSGRLAFGIVEDSNVFINNDKGFSCEYYKRKKVKWLALKAIDNLDKAFYEMKISRHSISSLKPYEDYIDRVTSTFYFKNNSANFVFEVNQDEDINLIQLVDLISSIQKLVTEINTSYGFNENVEDNIIKLNLQSRGIFSLKADIGKSLAMFGIIFTLFECTSQNNNSSIDLNPEDNKKASEFVEMHSDTLINIERRMIQMKVNRDKIVETFK